ncbi:Fanconi anemia group J protein [Histomonas meleagridis]|uniref:Fanconi anemia group J protein-like n=1 Tax=Histomonas meleagridis TaxID=135588 RepID=UPI0035593CA6|nr:Fanconi anemia group J protein [Histomonas meleagridis]KAH0801479.1 Fanconi anemia group J protein-like [Histomonas meleagridis]
MNQNPVFMGIDVDFPYRDPYPAQRALMAKAMKCYVTQENALLESPTGTGKSLALLASSLAYQDHIFQHPVQPMPANESQNPDAPPKCTVWYTSRTHSQLKQLVGELKKLRYKPRMAILASRKQTCLNEAGLKSGDIDNFCKTVHKKLHKCVYGANTNQKYLPAEFLPPGEFSKFDLEDLQNYCRERTLCPYIISKNLMKDADLILAPYTYIVSSSIRNQLKIDLTGAIVIIDEAHNIESTCRESASLAISLQTARTCYSLSVMSDGDKILYPSLVDAYSCIHGIFTVILEYFEQKRTEFESIDRHDNNYIEERSTKDCLASMHLTVESWPLIKRDFNEIFKADKKSGNPNEGDRFPSEALVTFLDRIFIGFEMIFANNGQNFEYYKIIYQYNRDDSTEDQIKFICLHPGVSFSPLSASVHSILLTSGTLSPLDSFATELGTKFPRENSLSAPHVIDPSQVQCYPISVSPSGMTLNSSYSYLSSNSESTYKSLGDVLTTLLPSIPDGVLFFLSSHNILKNLIKSWRKSGIYKKINSIKPIFLEEQKKTFDKVYNEFKKSIDLGKGGLFLGVCRGKISEGMDFSDNQARAVFAFGIPYPNLKDADVTLKRAFNDTHPGFVSGKEWYEIQAYRSLSQAIGRCIRNSRDYGAIFLLDQRFESIIDKLPNWVRHSIITRKKYNEIQSNLVTFFANMSVKFPMKPVETLNFNANAKLTCALCSTTLCIDAKFELNPAGKIDVGVTASQYLKSFFDVETDVFVCYIKNDSIGKNCFEETNPEYVDRESIAYIKLLCPKCKQPIGVKIHAVSRKNIKSLDCLWIDIDRVWINQAGISQPLSKMVQKPKVLSMELLSGAKALAKQENK